MIKLNKLNKPEEMKQGMTILSIDKGHNQALEKIDCIDNNKIYTECLVTGSTTPKNQPEDVNEYFDSQYYDSVYEVTI
jgi:hypothetical protein